MSATIETARGCAVGVACGYLDPVDGRLVRLSIHPHGAGERWPTAEIALTRDEALTVAKELLARAGAGIVVTAELKLSGGAR